MELPCVDKLSDDDAVGEPVKPIPKLSPAPKSKAKGSPKPKPKALSPKPKQSMKRPAAAEETIATEGVTVSMKRPAAALETAGPKDESPDEPTPPPMKRPAADRLSTSERAYKYLYHKKGMWGIKLNKREMLTVRSLGMF